MEVKPLEAVGPQEARNQVDEGRRPLAKIAKRDRLDILKANAGRSRNVAKQQADQLDRWNRTSIQHGAPSGTLFALAL